MRNSSIWKVIISGGLALICIVIVQGYWLSKVLDQSEKAFEEKVHIALRNVAQEISELKKVQLPSHDLINQISQDYYIVNIRDAIDATNLEYYLLKEFETIGLRTDFDYGIYDCDTDQMVYGNYISATANVLHKAPVKDLEAPEQSDYIYYFGVRFPDRQSYILKNQWVPLIFTIILCLAMLFFVYATYEILRQKKLSDLQKDFINNMTHEFKTPLSSIKVSSEVFLTNAKIGEDPRLYRYAGIINDQATRLNDQIERVLQIAGLQKGKIRLQLQEVNVKIVVEEVVEQLRGRCEKEEVLIETDFAGTGFEVKADPHHLANILYNLIDNAIKYSRNQPHIIIGLSSAGQEHILSIQDNGIGIEEVHLKKLGQKFFRVPTGDIHNAKGFGLGLHYVRQMVRMHRWKMHITSEPGKGTTILILMKRS
ncbi:MAG: HAMP domain-containing histidine kinase [Saprospiraceae bacterium]|nr:HAMP domain-containing histidine kinase [Saprospiraceae bacterium]